jgi:hypothetical protein
MNHLKCLDTLVWRQQLDVLVILAVCKVHTGVCISNDALCHSRFLLGTAGSYPQPLCGICVDDKDQHHGITSCALLRMCEWHDLHSNIVPFLSVSCLGKMCHLLHNVA